MSKEFATLYEKLKKFCEDDHYDNTILNRNEIVILVEGIKQLLLKDD